MSAQGPTGSSPAGDSQPSALPNAGSTNPGSMPRVPVTTGSIPTSGSIPTTGAHRIIVDPSRRADVLFRVRRDDDHEVSAWWMIGAFLAVSTAVIVLLSFVPGGT
ncbi:hypothetical protein ACPW96_09605 [Micromonospora sp. DT81.3]|uniref:hypothetical protein n=1 Tax=Actinomycetes TaxID=1760 RepID=UPI003CF6509E